MQGLTITEISQKLGITYLAAKQRLLRAGIKPITKEALYDASALDAIKDTVMGRPKKAVPIKTTKKPAAKKGKK